MSSFDAGRIVATADLDRTPFQHGLRLVRDEGRKFEQEEYKAKVGAETTAAERDLSTFKQRLESVDRTRAQARVALDNGEATRKLITFQERLDQMRSKVATARVDADTDAARLRLDELDIQLRKVGVITARPKVNLEGVERANLQLDALGLKLATVGSVGGVGGGGGRGGFAGGGRGGIFSRLPNPSWMALGIGAAIPATVPFAGLAGGVAGGALSAGVTGGLGLGAFGLGAKQNIATITGDITKLNKLTGQYNVASTNKQRAAVLVKEQALWKALDPAQRAAVKNVQALDSAWASYKKKLEPQTFAVVSDGAKIANTGLKYLLPTAQAVGDEIDILAQRAERAFKAPFWHQFFGAFLPGEAARSVDALGTTLGHVGTGVAHLVQDFAPLAHLLEGGSTSLSARFEKWTEGAGPGKFVAWVEKEGPPAAEALGSLAKGVKGLAEGFAPIGQLELKALTPILNFLGKLGDEHPAVITALGGALLTLGAGLKAVKLVGSIPGLGRIGGGGGLGGGGGIIGKVEGAAGVRVFVTNMPHGGLPGGPGLPGGGRKPPEPGTGVPVGGTALHDLKTGGKLLRAGDLAEGGRMILQGAARSPIDPLAVVLAAITRGSTPYPDAPNIDYQHRLAHSTIGQQRVAGQTLSRLQNPSNFPGTDVPTAVGTIVKYGSPAQLQQLQALADKNKEVAAALAAMGANARTSANDLDNAKSSVAHLRAEFASLSPQVTRSLGALSTLPNFLKDAEQAALNGGFIVGANLKKGIIVGFESTHGTVQLTNISQSVNGRTQVHTVRAQLAAGGPAAAGSTYLVGEKGPELFTPHTAGTVHSTSSTFNMLGQQLARTLAVGFAGFTASFEKLFSKALDRQINHLGTQLSNAANQYRSDLSARASLASQISGGIMSSGSIANASLSNTGGATVGGFLAGQISQDRQFSAAIAKLRARHLDPRLLQQITDAGPQQGLILAQQILSGESISGLNKQEKTLAGLAGGIGSNVAGAAFSGTLSGDARQIARLATAAEKLLSKQLHLSASSQRALAREIAAEFNHVMPYLNLKALGHARAIRIYAS